MTTFIFTKRFIEQKKKNKENLKNLISFTKEFRNVLLQLQDINNKYKKLIDIEEITDTEAEEYTLYNCKGTLDFYINRAYHAYMTLGILEDQLININIK